MKIFITGGAGYCGSLLVPKLLAAGNHVSVFDVMNFGSDHFTQNDNLKIINGDIRDASLIETEASGHDIFISLACVSNDASFELDEGLSTSINLDAFEPMVIAAKKAGCKRFIYASSSSVYGVSEAKDVTEDHPLVPLTLYNKYKGMCEPLLKKHTDENFVGVTFRPATVCGYAPRLRLDLSVNILTNHAVNNNKITVFGGDQLRPNLHVEDYCDAVMLLMSAPSHLIADEIFNIGYQNMSILDIASVVKGVVEEEFPEKAPIDIVRTESSDNRSYHINSDKITRVLGFKPQRSIADAVRQLCQAFKDGKIPNSFDDDIYFNVKRMLNQKVS
jgi:nucleoside-diphosphate-sugar epimerase